MQPLAPPHTHFLNAAQGWLELGNLIEARAELTRIESPFAKHPDVLQLQWAIAVQAADWPAALAIARELLRDHPELPASWLHHSYALRRAPHGGLAAAWDALKPALDKFPGVTLIPYNLTCYACQLGNLDEARALYKQALKTADPKALRELALNDSDLQLLWPEIKAT